MSKIKDTIKEYRILIEIACRVTRSIVDTITDVVDIENVEWISFANK